MLIFKLAKGISKIGIALSLCAGVKHKTRKLKKLLAGKSHPALVKENELIMKKSTFAAILVFMAAAVGALTAGALYLRHREKELDEYEQLLFSEEFNDEIPDDDDSTTVDEAAEQAEAPAAVDTTEE